MTDLDVLLFTVLRGLVADQCYPRPAPPDLAGDYLVHFDVTNARETDLDGAGVDMSRRIRKQIDVYSGTLAGAKALADAVRDAMDGATTFSASEMPGSGGGMYEPETKRHHVVLDFSVWQV